MTNFTEKSVRYNRVSLYFTGLRITASPKRPSLRPRRNTLRSWKRRKPWKKRWWRRSNVSFDCSWIGGFYAHSDGWFICFWCPFTFSWVNFSGFLFPKIVFPSIILLFIEFCFNICNIYIILTNSGKHRTFLCHAGWEPLV